MEGWLVIMHNIKHVLSIYLSIYIYFHENWMSWSQFMLYLGTCGMHVSLESVVQISEVLRHKS